MNKIFDNEPTIVEFCLTIRYEHYTNKFRQNDGERTNSIEKLCAFFDTQY